MEVVVGAAGYGPIFQWARYAQQLEGGLEENPYRDCGMDVEKFLALIREAYKKRCREQKA